MASRFYQNFDLLIEAHEDGSYRTRVTNSPLGESPSAAFWLPFEPTQLENLMLRLDPGRSGTRRITGDPQARAALELGGKLFESVFSEDIMLVWSRSQDITRAAGSGLRIRLRLTDAPAIAGLPWELLYDRRRDAYLAQSERTPLVRYLEVPDPPRPLAVNGALRILVVVSSPSDLPELDVEAEWRRVQDSLAPKIAEGTVRLDRLPQPTLAALSSWLRRNDVHILHFVGHGDFDHDLRDGVLFFCDRFGRRVKVPPNVLGPYLRDHDPLRLVVLNACQSARDDSTDPFSGMAQGLVKHDCTAVVAMQFPISDDAAVEFTGEFYGALADGLPVDQAATSGRKALLADYPTEWATPVLFLRAPDGRVFDHIVATDTARDDSVPAATEALGDFDGAAPAPQSAEMAESRRFPSTVESREATASDASPTVADVGASDETSSPPARDLSGSSARLTGIPSGTPGGEPDRAAPPGGTPSSTIPVSRRPRRWWLAAAAVGAIAILAAYVLVRINQSGDRTVTQTVTVPGNQLWTNTHIRCLPGERIDITAGGVVRHDTADPRSDVGPDGLTDPGYHQYNAPGLPDANTVALIGSIDQAQPFFVVGGSHSFTCDREGILFLGINDFGGLSVTNNSGAFVATITARAG